MGIKKRIHSLRTSWQIRQEDHFDGFLGLVVEGKQRVGKSSYVSQCLAEAFGEWEYKTADDKVIDAQCVSQDYREVQDWTVFPPKDFLKIVLNVSTKQLGLHWDDAGFWLFVLDWYDPFVKSVTKWIQLAGRQFTFFGMSSPSRKLISAKVLEALPEMYVARVTHDAGSDTWTRRPRVAKVYERWDYPDGKKGGVHTRWKDHFNAILPDDFYKWYKPVSDKYMEMGKEILRQEIELLEQKKIKKEDLIKQDDLMSAVGKVVGDEARISEVQELLKELGT